MLKKLTEKYYGHEIPTAEWRDALEIAKEKLANIIQRQGDGNGMRRESWYLAQLVAEEVITNRLMTETVNRGKRKALSRN